MSLLLRLVVQAMVATMDNVKQLDDSMFISALGAYQLGALFAWCLHGVLCVQIYNYIRNFPKDDYRRKLIVLFVLVLETVQIGCITRDSYNVVTAGFGNFEVINKVQTLPLTVPIMGGIVGLICHFSFAYFILGVSKSGYVAALIAMLGLCSSAFAFSFGGKFFAARTLSNVFQDISMARMSILTLTCGLWNGLGALCDIVIAVCMSFYLSRKPTSSQVEKSASFQKTDAILTRIIRVTVESNVITAIASIASTILFVGYRGYPQKGIFFILPAVISTRMYAITILATFNNRECKQKVITVHEVMVTTSIEQTLSDPEMIFKQPSPFHIPCIRELPEVNRNFEQ